jgi:PAS domain S-box-containing protein
LYISIIDAPAAKSFQSDFFARNPAIDPMTRIMAQAPGSSLFVKDSESRYVRANAGTLETYGLKQEEELIGRRNRDFFPALLADAYESEDRRVVESGEPLLNEIWLVPHVRGTPRWFVSSKAPLFDTAGKIIGLVGLMHPIATPEDQREHFQELRRVMEFIDQNFVDEITVERLAEIVLLPKASREEISSSFRGLHAKTPNWLDAEFRDAPLQKPGGPLMTIPLSIERAIRVIPVSKNQLAINESCSDAGPRSARRRSSVGPPFPESRRLRLTPSSAVGCPRIEAESHSENQPANETATR